LVSAWSAGGGGGQPLHFVYDGYCTPAVYAAVAEAIAVLLEGGGPVKTDLEGTGGTS